MDTITATLVFCLLALPFAAAQAEMRNSSITPPSATSGLNLTHVTILQTSSNSTVHPTTILNLTKGMTPHTGTGSDHGQLTNSTAGTTENTSHPQPSTSLTPLTNVTTLKNTTPNTQIPTLTALTTEANRTTINYSSTPGTPVFTTENSSHTSHSVNRTIQELGLSISEKSITIVFSVVLGLFVVALAVFMFQQCKHKIQYLHQPLNNTDDIDASASDGDTLVISGGLYEGHPIYDNVPPPSADQSQFRLEFLY